MKDSNKVELPEKLKAYLETQPEEGMGYHVVDLVVGKGQILKDRIVLNGTFLVLKDNETLTTEQIHAFYQDSTTKNKDNGQNIKEEDKGTR